MPCFVTEPSLDCIESIFLSLLVLFGFGLLVVSIAGVVASALPGVLSFVLWLFLMALMQNCLSSSDMSEFCSSPNFVSTAKMDLGFNGMPSGSFLFHNATARLLGS